MTLHSWCFSAFPVILISIFLIGCEIEPEEFSRKIPLHEIDRIQFNGEKTLEIYLLPGNSLDCQAIDVTEDSLDLEPYLLHRGRADVLNGHKFLLQKSIPQQAEGILYARVSEKKSEALLAYSCQNLLNLDETTRIKIELISAEKHNGHFEY